MDVCACECVQESLASSNACNHPAELQVSGCVFIIIIIYCSLFITHYSFIRGPINFSISLVENRLKVDEDWPQSAHQQLSLGRVFSTNTVGSGNLLIPDTLGHLNFLCHLKVSKFHCINSVF